MILSQDEIIDLYDANGKVIGNCYRSKFDKKNGLFLSVHLVVVNLQKKIIIQKRKNKNNDNGKWDILTGVVKSGEGSIDGAYRELQEELGIEKHNVSMFFINRIITNRNIMDVYKVEMQNDVDIIPNEQEISEIKIVTKEFLKRLFLQSHKELEYVNCIVGILNCE